MRFYLHLNCRMCMGEDEMQSCNDYRGWEVVGAVVETEETEETDETDEKET